MEQMERLEAFERMMADVSSQHAQTVEKMQALKAQGKERSATYRQLMGAVSGIGGIAAVGAHLRIDLAKAAFALGSHGKIPSLCFIDYCPNTVILTVSCIICQTPPDNNPQKERAAQRVSAALLCHYDQGFRPGMRISSQWERSH